MRKLLLAFSFLYNFITGVRNFFYDKGILKSQSFEVPVICVGNLNTGGTGKTPHVEYIIQLLKNKFVVATLSRGYGRTTKGFLFAKPSMSAEILGDEPYHYALKFPEAIVAVGEDRVNAIKNISSKFPGTDVIIMDDGLQHRAVKPGLSVLLTDYSNLFTRDYLLPSGNLRENKKGSKRTDVIIVTKCPALNENDKQKIITEISPLSHQKILFSYLNYDSLVPFANEKNKMEIVQLKDYSVLLITGIANPKSIINFLSDKVVSLRHLKFSDHHIFSKKEMRLIRGKFDNIAAQKKIIITTEKDFVRLKKEESKQFINDLPFYYLPVKVDFESDDKKIFETKILNYVGKNKRDR